MDNYSVQNSMTVKRLRNGDTFFISLNTGNTPLYQGVDPNTGSVSPAWGTGSGEITPIITPQVTSARGNTVTLSHHSWAYNGVTLTFSGGTITIGGVAYTKASNDSKFAMASSGALAIIANLASKDNVAADTLTYTCVATVAGAEYNLSKSIDVQIQSVGASSYYGAISADSEQLTKLVTSTTVKTALYIGGTVQTGYYVKWYKDTEVWTEKAGQSTITVQGSDVNGTQLFIAEFYKSEVEATSGGSPIYRAGIRITDTLDDYQVQYRYCNSDGTTTGIPNREVDTNKPVYVKAFVVSMRTNTELTTITSAAWESRVMDKDSWEALKTVTATGASQLISITTAETDVAGAQKDVEVVSEVTWTM